MLKVYLNKSLQDKPLADLYITYNSSVGEKSVGAKELLTQFLTFTKLGVNVDIT